MYPTRIEDADIYQLRGELTAQAAGDVASPSALEILNAEADFGAVPDRPINSLSGFVDSDPVQTIDCQAANGVVSNRKNHCSDRSTLCRSTRIRRR